MIKQMNNIILIGIDNITHNDYLYILLFFIVFDVVTGTLKAFSTNTVYSKINKKGVTNHITIFLLCFLFSWSFYIFKVPEYSKVLIMFYIISYGLSIIENLGKMGIPLPKWLIDKFKVLQEETDKGVESDEIKRD